MDQCRAHGGACESLLLHRTSETRSPRGSPGQPDRGAAGHLPRAARPGVRRPPDQRLRQQVRPARARPRWISGQCFGRWTECRWAVAAARRGSMPIAGRIYAHHHRGLRTRRLRPRRRRLPRGRRRGRHRHRPRLVPAARGGIQRGHAARHRLRPGAAAGGGHRALRRLRGGHRLRQRQHDGRGDRLAHLQRAAGRGPAVRPRARAVDARAGTRLRERRGPVGAGHPREARRARGRRGRAESA